MASINFGYVRVSTADQNPDLQIDALKAAGISEEHIFIDRMTGRSMERPQFKEMMKLVREGDTVTVWKLDRLGRNTKGLVELFEAFRKKGISFVSLTEKIDTTTITGQFMLTVMAGFAQMEADLNSERRKAGMEAARARGRMGGRPKVDGDKIKEAMILYRSKEYTVKQITKLTGISKATLYKYLREEETGGAARM